MTTSARRNLHLSLRFGSDCLRDGLDPLSFISYLSTLGDVVQLSTVTDLMPDLDQFDPERCYLDFEVTLSSDAPLESIEGVFEFVRAQSAIRILEPDSPTCDYVALVESFGQAAGQIEEILVRTGATPAAALAAGLVAGHVADPAPADPAPADPAPADPTVEPLVGLDGFLIEVGSAQFVLALDRVLECVELPAMASSQDCIDLRGEALPLIRLRPQFDLRGEPPRRESVVVVEHAGVKIGLVVDILLGGFQADVLPLGQLFEHVRGISGCTFLGNGEVALVIDVQGLIRHHPDRQPATLG
jgi:hypothetical protein